MGWSGESGIHEDSEQLFLFYACVLIYFCNFERLNCEKAEYIHCIEVLPFTLKIFVNVSI